MPKNSLLFPSQGFILAIDPLDAYPDISAAEIGNSLGLLPGFIVVDDHRPAAVQFAERYGFGSLHDMGGSIDDDGTYHSAYEEPTDEYSGDPPMKPVAHLRLRDEQIWFYPSAIVGIVNDNGDTFTTRMD